MTPKELSERGVTPEAMNRVKELAEKMAKLMIPLSEEQREAVGIVVIAFTAATRVCCTEASQKALVGSIDMLSELGNLDIKRMETIRAEERELSTGNYAEKFHEGNGTKH